MPIEYRICSKAGRSSCIPTDSRSSYGCMGEEMNPLPDFDSLPLEVQVIYLPVRECIDSLSRYVNNKIPTGGFLRAVLENDFMGAFNRADLNNTRNMDLIAKFVYNYVPMGARGSRAKVADWLGETRGLDNREGLR